MTQIATCEPISAPSAEIRTSTVVPVKSRLVGPDAFRALAILLVMLVHIPVEATPPFLVGVRN
jgi:peptidoglycan/LPS O-acetylase OafA/YrhL